MASNSVLKLKQDWMAQLPQKLKAQPLHTIAIPGSHDSFSFFLNKSSSVAPGSPDTIRNLVSVFGKPAINIVWNWSTTQALNFEQQLDLGIRYFDLRISTWKDKDNNFYFVHGLYGDLVQNGLQSINDWLIQHPQEVVMLDFNHLYAMDEEDHQRLLNLISDTFHNKLCPMSDVQEVTLQKLWEKQQQVLVFYHNQFITENNMFWSGSKMISFWPNTPEAPKMVDRLQAHYTRGRTNGCFCVFQGVLTPTGTTILQHIHKTLREVLAPRATKNVLHFIGDKQIGETGINVVIADFVEEHDFVSKVLKLNESNR